MPLDYPNPHPNPNPNPHPDPNPNPHPNQGSTLAVARVLGAAVCAAPEVVESMDAAGGGEGERLRGLLLSLSSQPDRRCLEELAPAWAALSPLTAAPGHAASWQQLAEVPATPCARGGSPIMCDTMR